MAHVLASCFFVPSFPSRWTLICLASLALVSLQFFLLFAVLLCALSCAALSLLCDPFLTIAFLSNKRGLKRLKCAVLSFFGLTFSWLFFSKNITSRCLLLKISAFPEICFTI